MFHVEHSHRVAKSRMRSSDSGMGISTRFGKSAETGAPPALVRIAIGYRIRATNDKRNLVYPFYLIPHDSEE